jgi:hypothetical protein
MSSRSHSVADIIGKFIIVVMRPPGGKGPASTRRSPLARYGSKPILFRKVRVPPALGTAQSAVERELVLRLASLLWRLRRATTMETGLFEIQAEHLREYRQNRQLLSGLGDGIHAPSQPDSVKAHGASHYPVNKMEALLGTPTKTDGPVAEFAWCFLRLANLPNFALDRLSRYEASLWRQAGQILYALEMLDRRKPQERRAHFWFGREKPIER